MARALLVAKGDLQLVGKNWPQFFLTRHPDLQSRFTQKMNKERTVFQTPENINVWFSFYEKTVQKYHILPEDTYNMDEKGIIIGLIRKLKYIGRKKKGKYNIR